MTLTRLKFPDKATAEGLLFELTPEGLRPLHRNIVMLGVIRHGGRWDDNYQMIEPPVVTPGYHVDIVHDEPLPVNVSAFAIPEPENPKHVIFGA